MFHWLTRKLRRIPADASASDLARLDAFPDTLQLTRPLQDASMWEPTVPLIGVPDTADGARDDNERRSLALLEARGISALQYVAETAARICETPMAAVSMMDGESVWFPAATGIELQRLPRAGSFCAQAMEGLPDLLIVPDALLDAQFSQQPMVVDAPHIRFYAGAPFVTANAVTCGTVSVADVVPRELTPVQRRTLELLARQTVMLLDARLRNEAEPLA